MKKIAILMVLALAACGEGKNTPAALVTPSVLDLLHDDQLLDSTFKTCGNSGEYDKPQHSLLCEHAYKAHFTRQDARRGSLCGLKHTPEEQKSCFDKEYDAKYKE